MHNGYMVVSMQETRWPRKFVAGSKKRKELFIFIYFFYSTGVNSRAHTHTKEK